MCFLKPVLEPLLALSNIGRTGIIRSISKPKGNVAAVETLGNLNAVECVFDRATSNRLVGICKRAVFVLLVLKEIGVDRTRCDTVTGGELLDLIGALYTVGAIP